MSNPHGHGPSSSESGAKEHFIKRLVKGGVEGLEDLAHHSGTGAIVDAPNTIKDFFGAGGGSTKGHHSSGGH